MGQTQASNRYDDEEKAALLVFIDDHQGMLWLLVFAAVVGVAALLVDFIGHTTIAAIILAWGFFIVLVVFLFTVVPLYGLELLDNRRR